MVYNTKISYIFDFIRINIFFIFRFYVIHNKPIFSRTYLDFVNVDELCNFVTISAVSICIAVGFGFLEATIKQLETRQMTLVQNVE